MSPRPFTWRGVRQGWRAAGPLAIGVAAYGLMFGVLSAGVGMSAMEATLLSTFVYSGSAQLALVQSWTPEVSTTALVMTVLVVNARYIVYGATLRPWLEGLGGIRIGSSLVVMGDANWALSLRQFEDGDDDIGFLFGSGLVMFVPWVVSTAVGHVMGQSIRDPSTFGLDFMFVAFSAALGIAMWRGSGDVWNAIAALLTAGAMAAAGLEVWAVIAAGVSSGAIASYRHVDER
ncbi:AzlC family ABC transporter permease [Roseococcus sp. YIM B11640]|uniref:AzlC family ABC transporter permease n=1 Tax=Roseococcus sp. YIM B11640 TaxID=3133973 RepID=UPI003C79757F